MLPPKTIPPLFHVGLVLAIAQVTASMEIAATLSHLGSFVRSVVLLMYPVAVALLGVGAAVEQRYFPHDDPRPPLRWAGVALLVFLGVALRANFLVATGLDLAVATILHVVTLSLWFLCLGAGLSRLLRAVHAGGPQGTARGWAVHVFGIFLGYAAADPLLTHVGANALLMVLAGSLLGPPVLGPPLFAALSGVAVVTGLDARLEDWRDLEVWRSGAIASFKENDDAKSEERRELASAEFQTVHLAWSRLGQFRLIQEGSATGELAGWYNFHPQWTVSPEPASDQATRLRRQVYGKLPPTGRVAIIGVGGGRGLLSLPFPAHSGILAVEQHPSVVDYFTRVAPEHNQRIFHTVTPAVGDGRQVVLRQTERFDAIVIESSRHTPATSLLPASTPLYHYTREAIGDYVDHLTQDGVFIAEFQRVQGGRGTTEDLVKQYLPAHVLSVLHGLGLQTVAKLSKRGSVYIVGCQSAACIKPFAEAELFKGATDWVPSERLTRQFPYELTDDTPFAAWGMMKFSEQLALLVTVAALGAGCLGAAFALRLRRAPEGGPAAAWNPVPCMFLIGLAHAALSIWTCHVMQTYYGDGVLTVTRVIAWLALYGAAGSALAPRCAGAIRGPGGPWARCGLAAAVFCLHLLLLSIVPFSEPSTWAREAAAALLLLPGGVAMGIFFPAALGSTSTPFVGSALLGDALGTLTGYLLFYLICLPFGSTAFAVVAVGGWVAAAYLLPSADRAG